MTQGIPSDSFNAPLRNVSGDEVKETSQEFLQTDPQPSISDRILERHSPKGRGQAGGRDLQKGGEGMRAEKVTERGKGGAYKK